MLIQQQQQQQQATKGRRMKKERKNGRKFTIRMSVYLSPKIVFIFAFSTRSFECLDIDCH